MGNKANLQRNRELRAMGFDEEALEKTMGYKLAVRIDLYTEQYPSDAMLITVLKAQIGSLNAMWLVAAEALNQPDFTPTDVVAVELARLRMLAVAQCINPNNPKYDGGAELRRLHAAAGQE